MKNKIFKVFLEHKVPSPSYDTYKQPARLETWCTKKLWTMCICMHWKTEICSKIMVICKYWVFWVLTARMLEILVNFVLSKFNIQTLVKNVLINQKEIYLCIKFSRHNVKLKLFHRQLILLILWEKKLRKHFKYL